MNRRKALSITAAAAGLAATSTASLQAEEARMKGGWLYKELEYEKHVPNVEVKRKDDMVAITVWVKHPQTPEHHISTFKIYDENRIELTECDLHPELSVQKVQFVLKVVEGTALIATSDCNIHGIWMKEFTA